jgi:hypothetical protein
MILQRLTASTSLQARSEVHPFGERLAKQRNHVTRGAPMHRIERVLVVSPGLPNSRTGIPSAGKVSTVMCVNDTRDSELQHVLTRSSKSAERLKRRSEGSFRWKRRSEGSFKFRP